MLNRHNLKIADLASKQESRFTLSGILVEPGRTVVTDGHMLAICTMPDLPVDQFPAVPGAPVPTDNFTPFVMPVASCAAILKALPKKNNLPVLTCAAVCPDAPESNGTRFVPVVTTDLERTQTETVRALTGTFPDYKRVMPTTEPTFEICMNATLVKRLMDQFISFHDDKSLPHVTFRFRGAVQAVELTSPPNNGGQTLQAILMPVRMGEKRKPEAVAEVEAVETVERDHHGRPMEVEPEAVAV